MKVDYDCIVCGTHKTGYRSKPAAVGRFCSYACKARWLSRSRKRTANNLPVRSGPEHPRWRHDIPRELRCEACGNVYASGPDAGTAMAQGRKFCSRKCGPGVKWGAKENNPNWTGGPEARKARGARSRSCLEQRNWSRAVLQRDDFTCQFCGQRGGDLQADHVKPFRDFPELRWDISNGRTLCKPCHYTTFQRSQKTG
jgi:5-methylcytosine-specific restriction endonuclease McrA